MRLQFCTGFAAAAAAAAAVLPVLLLKLLRLCGPGVSCVAFHVPGAAITVVLDLHGAATLREHHKISFDPVDIHEGHVYCVFLLLCGVLMDQ